MCLFIGIVVYEVENISGVRNMISFKDRWYLWIVKFWGVGKRGCFVKYSLGKILGVKWVWDFGV